MIHRNALLKEIQAEDFAVYEAALYLSAHPNCQKALEYYSQHKALAKQLRDEFEANYGPLTIYGNEDPHCWRWVSSPWPWEKEAN